MLPRTLALILLSSSLLAAEPEKLIKLRGSYDAAVQKAVAPLQKTYLQELEKMKLDFTRAGKLEDAIAVSEELKKFSAGTAAPTSENVEKARSAQTSKEMLDYLCSKVWIYSKAPDKPLDSYEIFFRPDGSVGQTITGSPNTKNWSWVSVKKGVINLNRSGEIKFELGSKLLEHPVAAGTRWLILSETTRPADETKR